MASLFGYLVLLVFYKWTAYDASSSKAAPSLLIHFINMCLFNYNDPTNKPLYPGQVLVFKIYIFILLVPTEYFLLCRDMFNNRAENFSRLLGHDLKGKQIPAMT